MNCLTKLAKTAARSRAAILGPFWHIFFLSEGCMFVFLFLCPSQSFLQTQILSNYCSTACIVGGERVFFSVIEGDPLSLVAQEVPVFSFEHKTQVGQSGASPSLSVCVSLSLSLFPLCLSFKGLHMYPRCIPPSSLPFFAPSFLFINSAPAPTSSSTHTAASLSRHATAFSGAPNPCPPLQLPSLPHDPGSSRHRP